MHRNRHARRPFANAEGAGDAGNATETTGAKADASAAATDTAKAAKTFTQAELDRIVQKRVAELSGASKERDELAAKVAEYEAEKQKAEEAKLNATQRAELERKREREGYEKRVADLTAAATKERDERHKVLRAGQAASLVATVAAKLHSAAALPIVQREVASRLVVRAEADGTEKLYLRMSEASEDLEPVETGFAKLVDSEIAPAFFKAAGGAGSQGGNGGGNSGPRLTGAAAFAEAYKKH